MTVIYKVAVTETKRLLVAVEASTQTEAHRRVIDAWQNSEIMLTDKDFEGVEVFVIGEADEHDHLPKVERKD